MGRHWPALPGLGQCPQIALAKRFVATLDLSDVDAKTAKQDPGILYWEIKTESDSQRDLVTGVRSLWDKYPVLGLTAKEGVPEQPTGPSLACHAEITDTAIEVKLTAATHPARIGILVDRFRLKLSELEPEPMNPPQALRY